MSTYTHLSFIILSKEQYKYTFTVKDYLYDIICCSLTSVNYQKLKLY